jgi:hypothetical protein
VNVCLPEALLALLEACQIVLEVLEKNWLLEQMNFFMLEMIEVPFRELSEKRT